MKRVIPALVVGGLLVACGGGSGSGDKGEVADPGEVIEVDPGGDPEETPEVGHSSDQKRNYLPFIKRYNKPLEQRDQIKLELWHYSVKDQSVAKVTSLDKIPHYRKQGEGDYSIVEYGSGIIWPKYKSLSEEVLRPSSHVYLAQNNNILSYSLNDGSISNIAVTNGVCALFDVATDASSVAFSTPDVNGKCIQYAEPDSIFKDGKVTAYSPEESSDEETLLVTFDTKPKDKAIFLDNRNAIRIELSDGEKANIRDADGQLLNQAALPDEFDFEDQRDFVFSDGSKTLMYLASGLHWFSQQDLKSGDVAEAVVPIAGERLPYQGWHEPSCYVGKQDIFCPFTNDDLTSLVVYKLPKDASAASKVLELDFEAGLSIGSSVDFYDEKFYVHLEKEVGNQSHTVPVVAQVDLEKGEVNYFDFLNSQVAFQDSESFVDANNPGSMFFALGAPQGAKTHFYRFDYIAGLAELLQQGQRVLVHQAYSENIYRWPALSHGLYLEVEAASSDQVNFYQVAAGKSAGLMLLGSFDAGTLGDENRLNGSFVTNDYNGRFLVGMRRLKTRNNLDLWTFQDGEQGSLNRLTFDDNNIQSNPDAAEEMPLEFFLQNQIGY